jgi:hypothetical protein
MTAGTGQGDDIETVPLSLDELSRLSGWVAHEVNNPLGGLLNAFALVRDAIPATHPRFKYVAAIDREIARLTGVTRRLYQTYSTRPDRGAAVPLSSLLADALHLLEPLSTGRDVRVKSDIDAAVAAVRLSGELQRSAVRHLVQVGIEATAPGETLTIRGWREDDFVWLAVPRAKGEDHLARGVTAGPPGFAAFLVRRVVVALGGRVVDVGEQETEGALQIGLPITNAGATSA